MNRSTPAIIAGVLLVAAIVVFFVTRDSDDESTEPTTTTSAAVETTTTTTTGEQGGGDEDKPDKPPKPEIETIVIKGGQPVGGVAELTFTEGDDIRFRVESDVAEEVHLHGYDVSQDVEAGGSVEFDVPATLTGVFEAELEHSVVPIAEITVNPA
jgi:heme/copper-type cytochrome/quinol oxidase subunit 2